MEYDWRNWIELARREMEHAGEALEVGAYFVTAFFAQQTAEESLKGLWIATSDGVPPHTHNLVELAAGLGAPEEIVDACMRLNPHYSASRYPDIAQGNPAGNYSETLASQLLGDAKEVFALCSSQLQS
ncbi:MAG: HEPN domain-containing protein [Tepidiformaceae bacterium]